MTWRDDLNRALRNIKEITGIPENDDTKDEEILKVLRELWKDAKNFDSSWDSD
jgi:hypothetical protein